MSKAIKTRNKSLITSSIFRRRFNKLSLIDEVIFDSGRIVIPASQRKKEIEDYHLCFSHESAHKLKLRFQKKYFWPSMKKEIQRYVSECDTCQKTKFSSPTVAQVGRSRAHQGLHRSDNSFISARKHHISKWSAN